MRPINARKQGFFTIAQNNSKVDYVRLAYGLALSLKHSQREVPYLTVAITPGTEVDEKYAWAFDNIVEIPWGDQAAASEWKLENEWKSIWMSPYDETIKVESDMLFFTDISEWWSALANQPRDVVWTNVVKDWKGLNITSDYYRKLFTKDKLPNIYTGLGYFRKTDAAYEVFDLAKIISWNWETFFDQFFHASYRPTNPSTDVIFALAMKLTDIDQNDYTPHMVPTFTHMKSQLQGWNNHSISEDWQQYLRTFFTPNAECKIGNHRQVYPLHYHIKEWLTDDMIHVYERLVGRG
jgi:hypothetical protein